MVAACVSLTDVVAERRLVALVLHGPEHIASVARACLEAVPPTIPELRHLLAGRVPTLHKGIYEARTVRAEWPVGDTVAELVDRVWIAQARRELLQVAMNGNTGDVRRCWAILHHMREPEATSEAPAHHPPASDESR